jgi:hypothetical protein
MPIHHGSDIAYRAAVGTLAQASTDPVYTTQSGTVGAPNGLTAGDIATLRTILAFYYVGDTLGDDAPIYYTTVYNPGATPEQGNYYSILSVKKHPVVLYDDNTVLVGPNVAVPDTVPPNQFTTSGPVLNPNLF